MKQLNGIYNVPLVTIIIMGFFLPAHPGAGGKSSDGDWHNQLHHHQLSGEVRLPFPLCAGLYVLHQRGRDAGDRFYQTARHAVHLQRCVCGGHETVENVKIASIGILFAMIGVYAGLAEFGGYGTRWLAMISYFIAAVVIVYLILTAGGIVIPP